MCSENSRFWGEVGRGLLSKVRERETRGEGERAPYADTVGEAPLFSLRIQLTGKQLPRRLAVPGQSGTALPWRVEGVAGHRMEKQNGEAALVRSRLLEESQLWRLTPGDPGRFPRPRGEVCAGPCL